MNTPIKLFFTTVLLLMAFSVYGLYTFATTVFWPVSAPICAAVTILVGYAWVNVGGFMVLMKTDLPDEDPSEDWSDYVDPDDL